MMRNQIFKYKIGLGVLGILTAVLLIMVVVQGSAAKHDKKTFEKADAVASKLDLYVLNRGVVPSSLKAAGIRDVPEEVSYRKLSADRYEFCVNYKTGTSFDAEQIQSDLLTGGAYSKYNSRSSNQESSYLQLSPSHKKGKNCQKIKAYSYTGNYYDINNSDFDTQSF